MKEQNKNKNTSSLGSKIATTLIILFIVICVSGVLAVKMTGIHIYTVSGQSMEPTIHEDSYVLVNESKKIKNFDIITFKNQDSGDILLKRVIGIPGDEITVIDGHIFINDGQYEEPYIEDTNKKMFQEETFKVVVPKDSYFVLGDNRDASGDSRVLGVIKKENVTGVVILFWEGDK